MEEEKGEGPSSTVELFRVEAPDAPGTVGPAAHEFTTFDAYAGQPPPPGRNARLCYMTLL